MLKRIVSGGQTGADRAALDVALERGLEIGGWIPAGRLAEDGPIPERYTGLQETSSADPAVRTARNVRDSDATLIVSHGPLSGGSLLTFEEAIRHDRPVLHLDRFALSHARAVAGLREWLRVVDPAILNVAGPRASHDPAICDTITALLREVLPAPASRTYREVSLWFDTLPDPVVPRAALDGDATVDVAIVGAGYSGLWTAYYLACLRPELRIALLEAEVAGFGASGRNGGWCIGLLAGMEGLLSRPERRAEGLALQRAMFDAVDEVGRVCAAEGIDCHYRKGGSLRLAVNEAQRRELRERVSALGELFTRDDFTWLEPEECARRVRVAGALGGLYTPHCAAIHPARLARGLASCVERLGVRIHEGTRVTRLEPGRAVTDHGVVRAEVVVRATEAYTALLRGHHRALLPLHSWMLATEPLPAPIWKEIGLDGREAFGDARRMVTYGQRTADGRLAFGGLASYRFGSRIERRFPSSHPRFLELERILHELLPPLRGVRITHRWGGALGVPRDWRPRVGLDRGFAWIGGYVGEGVAASNLAGRTLAELIAGAESERVRLAWVAPPAGAWEPEPLRFLAVRGVLGLIDAADRASVRGQSSDRHDRWIRRIAGR